MDAKSILEQLLASGKELVEQGKDLAEDKIGLPEDEQSRAKMLDGAKKGAIGASVLAILLGTGAGRAVGGAALKMGSLAAVGGLAYKALQSWQGVRSTKPLQAGPTVDQLKGEEAENRNIALLRAMVAAAKADGHIDEEELTTIQNELGKMKLDGDTLEFLQAELTKPLSAADVAAGADSKHAAAEIYLVSRIIISDANAQETSYLAELSKQLGLNESLVAELNHKATS